ncbi:hypothetical protein COB21_00490, partial [Candidatus Aerophobetes bacterium]
GFVKYQKSARATVAGLAAQTARTENLHTAAKGFIKYQKSARATVAAAVTGGQGVEEVASATTETTTTKTKSKNKFEQDMAKTAQDVKRTFQKLGNLFTDPFGLQNVRF